MFIISQREQLFPPVVCAHAVTHLYCDQLLFARALRPEILTKKVKESLAVAWWPIGFQKSP
jgi:hypothetical protein